MVPQPPSPSVWRGRKGRYEAQMQMPHHNRWCWFKGVLPFHALEPNPIHDKGRSKAVSLCCAKILVKPLGFLPWVLFLSLSLCCAYFPSALSLLLKREPLTDAAATVRTQTVTSFNSSLQIYYNRSYHCAANSLSLALPLCTRGTSECRKGQM